MATAAFVLPQIHDPAAAMIIVRQPGIDRLSRQFSPRICGEIPLTAAGDLLGRPALAQPLLDILTVLWLRELAAFGPAFTPPTLGQLLGSTSQYSP